MKPSSSLTHSLLTHGDQLGGIAEADHDQDYEHQREHQHEHEHAYEPDHIDALAHRTVDASRHLAAASSHSLVNPNTAARALNVDVGQGADESSDQASAQPAALSLSDKLFAAVGMISPLTALTYRLATRMGNSSGPGTAIDLRPDYLHIWADRWVDNSFSWLGNPSTAANTTNVRSIISTATSGDPTAEPAPNTGAFQQLFDAVTGLDNANLGPQPRVPLCDAESAMLASRLREIPITGERFAMHVPPEGISEKHRYRLAAQIVDCSRRFILTSPAFVPGLVSEINRVKKIVSDNSVMNESLASRPDEAQTKAQAEKAKWTRTTNLVNAQAELARLELLRPAFDRYVAKINRLSGQFDAVVNRRYDQTDR